MRCNAEGILYGDVVLVPSIEDSRCLYAHGFYGKPLGVDKPKGPDFDAPLRLTLLEAVYLVEEGVLRLYTEEDPVELGDLVELARSRYRDFDVLYSVYRRLRSEGLIVRSGLKYGSDFTVYRYGPGIDHAPFIVHVRGYSEDLEPTDIIRAGRLSHSVKKTFILASQSPTGEPKYLIFKWFRP